VFLVDRDGTLVTPPAASVLHGVTRRSTIEIAEHDGISVREQRVRPDDLMSAAEVFLTGTSAMVMPVASVDDKPIGDQVPGPVSQRLRERFEAVMAGREPDFEHWLSFVDAG
jgi:branched-chain amino acid aminotransferase